MGLFICHRSIFPTKFEVEIDNQDCNRKCQQIARNPHRTLGCLPYRGELFSGITQVTHRYCCSIRYWTYCNIFHNWDGPLLKLGNVGLPFESDRCDLCCIEVMCSFSSAAGRQTRRWQPTSPKTPAPKVTWPEKADHNRRRNNRHVSVPPVSATG